MAFTLSGLAEFVTQQGMTCAAEGDVNRPISGVATLDDAGPDDISFLANVKYEKALQTTNAGAVIV
jgi:UDP-3-O-[3-hydroxymyristoyl] glucosamine N-acyltransferase